MCAAARKRVGDAQRQAVGGDRDGEVSQAAAKLSAARRAAIVPPLKRRWAEKKAWLTLVKKAVAKKTARKKAVAKKAAKAAA
jgi:hypothetical protein